MGSVRLVALYIVAFLFPPLAVMIVRGECDTYLLLNLLLTLLAWLPGWVSWGQALQGAVRRCVLTSPLHLIGVESAPFLLLPPRLTCSESMLTPLCACLFLAAACDLGGREPKAGRRLL